MRWCLRDVNYGVVHRAPSYLTLSGEVVQQSLTLCCTDAYSMIVSLRSEAILLPCDLDDSVDEISVELLNCGAIPNKKLQRILQIIYLLVACMHLPHMSQCACDARVIEFRGSPHSLEPYVAYVFIMHETSANLFLELTCCSLQSKTRSKTTAKCIHLCCTVGNY